MKPYLLVPAAQRDLSAIWDYTLEMRGAAQAELYIDDLRDGIKKIAADPSRGRRCDDIREGYRRYSVRSHIVFYRERSDAVIVVRVLHKRMDVWQHVGAVE